MIMRIFYIFALLSCLQSEVPENRIVAEWEPAIGTMMRWPLGIPSDLVIELARDEIIYVLLETDGQANQATATFNNWGVNIDNVVFIQTGTYTHWTRDYGPKFLIGEGNWKVVNQEFSGYPEENGCQENCDADMVLIDCDGNEYCNNQPNYSELGYDCYVNNEYCDDFNSDGQIIDWLGDGFCDDGSYGVNFMCDEYSWDCGDCGGEVNDINGYCDDGARSPRKNIRQSRSIESQIRGWDEDDDTNIDFANQLEWDILNLPLFWTGGNFITDGYGMGFSTKIMINENNIEESEFYNIIEGSLSINNYHIFENPNEESIQHIDCLAKLVTPETVIIKQVSDSSPEYECIEEFASSFYELNTFYGRPFNIHRIFCPEINGGEWELNPVAAYTNSYILNNKIFVPQYGIDEDVNTLEIYQQIMPGYDVIGIHSSEENPWYAEDALHCRTIGVFDPHMMHISHKSIRNEELTDNDLVFVDGEVVNYGQYELVSVKLFWKYGSENTPFNEININFDSDNKFSGAFPSLNPNSGIKYYIQSKNSNGDSFSHPNFGWHTFTSINNSLKVIKNTEKIIPQVCTLYQNYPNPFNPITNLKYELPEDSYVRITIYDMLGNVINNLVKSNQSSGYKSIQWNATNNQGQPVSAGVYLYSIEAGDFRQTKKMILLK